MSQDSVVIKGVIRRDGRCAATAFGGVNFSPSRCPHDIEDKVMVKVTSDQWEHVVSKSSLFIVIQAEMIDGCLDTTQGGAGVLASPDARIYVLDADTTQTLELCSGGFSGWTHAMRRLNELGYRFDHRLALDFDEDCAEMYSKSHGFEHVIGPQNFDWGNEEMASHLFVISDLCEYRWCHLLSNRGYDLAVASPPCPPWSLATSCPGLLKHEGRLTLHVLGILNLIRPRVFTMEMVASMKRHEHWPLIRRFVEWMGYTMRYASTLNLAEIFPQQRDRLILICTNDSFEFPPHRCLPWPAVQRQNLETFMNIMNLSSPWIEDTVIQPHILAMYMSPDMIPKSNKFEKPMTKKSRKDVEAYRLKYPQSVFGCILANYSYGHLLPEHSLKNYGLFGSILALPEGLRFMSLPEVVIAQGALNEMWMPNDHRKAMKMLGNCITTPHALVGIVNALCYLRDDIIGVEAQQLIIEALAGRFTAFNLRFEPKDDGWHFTKDDNACLPTLQMHSTYKVSLKSPMGINVFHAEREIIIYDAVSFLTGDSMPGELAFLPGGKLEHKVALPRMMDVADEAVTLFANVPSALRISKDGFSSVASHGRIICVLTKHGTYMLRRDEGMTVADVVLVMDHHCEIPCTHLTGCLGERHQQQSLCPDAVIGRDVETQSNDLRVLDYVNINPNAIDITFKAGSAALQEFSQMITTTGLDEILQAFGWMFAVDAFDAFSQRVDEIRLMPKPGAFSITCEELTFFLALQLFLIKIRSWEVVGHEPFVRCRIKLWQVWIWDGLVDRSMKLERFNDEWTWITALFNIQKPWRFVINGRSINPGWPLESFIEPQPDGSGLLIVNLLLGLQGGGPVKLVSSDQALNAGNFSGIAEFEANNFSAALSFVLQKVVDSKRPRQEFDISKLLQLQASFHEGFFVINGQYKLQQTFLQLLKDSGIEKTLDYCGWIVVCRFVQIFHPTIASIMFVRKPSAAAVTMEFLRAVLRSSLIFLGLPPAIPLRDGTVLTKVKLWNVVVFHDYWDRNLPLQDLVDTWDQACSILNDSIPVRLVGAGGNMNPDFPLRYFTRSNPEGITVSTISFVVGMRGGGPSDSSSSSEQKEIVKQRNNLATFLLSEGADLKECTRFVDSIFKAAGHTAVGMILAQKNTNMKWEGIVQLANTMHVKPPDRTSRLLKTNKKIHARFAGQNRLITDDIQVDTLILQKGFVRNSDDSDCPQTQKVVPNSSGVVLMKYGDAKPWIDAQETISQDELAIAVVGHCGDDSGSCQKCQIPVTYHGSPLILQACLHNLGAKHVSLQCDDHDEIPCHETHVIGFTAFKEEISPEDWQRLIKSPVKNILQRLFGENAEIGFSTPPWGRSFFDNGKRSDPEHATTVQFHGRISKTDLKATLKASGTSGIYTVPKSEDRKISSGYRIVWLQQSPVDLTISLSKCSNHLGLVRSARGSLHNRGIRFEKDDFPGAFSLLRPSDPLPNLVSSNFYFKCNQSRLVLQRNRYNSGSTHILGLPNR